MWIRHTTIENRLDLMMFIAQETESRMTTNARPAAPSENIIGGPKQGLHDMSVFTYILDANRNVVASNTPPMLRNIDLSSLSDEEGIQKFTSEASYYAVQQHIIVNDELIGFVVVIDTKSNVEYVNQQYGQLGLIIIVLGLLGWCAIYMLSRRLARPINQVAAAAKQVQEGNYALSLPSEVKEQEVYELVSSFEEMASKLQQLEKTRTELLAGVTHELKTPVTSISGLLQALKDEVVTGDEAKEFLEMAMNETTKMKTLVGDLLAFNSYAVDAIPLNLTQTSVNNLVLRNVEQWQVMQASDALEIQVERLTNDDEIIKIDSVRMQQIFTNLLNNAAQAMNHIGIITIKLRKHSDDTISLSFSDEGGGIQKKDQPFIFERFYRGENKKFTTRGLGLGLPLSKMMAKSLGGDLQLVQSSANGTTFELILPIAVDLHE